MRPYDKTAIIQANVIVCPFFRTQSQKPWGEMFRTSTAKVPLPMLSNAILTLLNHWRHILPVSYALNLHNSRLRKHLVNNPIIPDADPTACALNLTISQCREEMAPRTITQLRQGRVPPSRGGSFRKSFFVELRHWMLKDAIAAQLGFELLVRNGRLVSPLRYGRKVVQIFQQLFVSVIGSTTAVFFPSSVVKYCKTSLMPTSLLTGVGKCRDADNAERKAGRGRGARQRCPNWHPDTTVLLVIQKQTSRVHSKSRVACWRSG